MDRDVETVTTSVFHQQILAFDPLHRARDQTTKYADAVLDMDDEIPRSEVGEVGLWGDLAAADRAPGLWTAPAEDLRVRQKMHRGKRLSKIGATKNPAFGQGALDESEWSLWWSVQFVERRDVLMTVLHAPQFSQAVCLPGGDDHLPTRGLRGSNVLQHRLQLTAKMGAGDEAVGQERVRAAPSKGGLLPVPQREDGPVGQPLRPLVPGNVGKRVIGQEYPSLLGGRPHGYSVLLQTGPGSRQFLRVVHDQQCLGRQVV